MAAVDLNVVSLADALDAGRPEKITDVVSLNINNVLTKRHER